MASAGCFFSVDAKIIILVICIVASVWVVIHSLKIRAMGRGVVKFHRIQETKFKSKMIFLKSYKLCV